MKPEKLVISAFGYMQTGQRLILQSSGGQGIYLITGDTGQEKRQFLMRSPLPCTGSKKWSGQRFSHVPQ